MVTVVSGDNHQDLDAGLPPAVVSGYVIEDTNADGNLDAAETALKNVTVTLTGTDVFGTPVTATTTTNDNGEYSFTVPAGNYTLVTTNLVDYLSSGSQPGQQPGSRGECGYLDYASEQRRQIGKQQLLRLPRGQHCGAGA
ncbi:SdrD B-like domain-containing protein [Candidatus Thiothrix anitrata]|uniref:SdrD B-like domain-containing protein n=1 Tax=Candidatus Thiothrix anitrata TaxID=2823902 RepID=UPI002B1BE242|nr:SdrD B-like domain-containing protein [Candidatus Thiothrix anitrata]